MYKEKKGGGGREREKSHLLYRDYKNNKNGYKILNASLSLKKPVAKKLSMLIKIFMYYKIRTKNFANISFSKNMLKSTTLILNNLSLMEKHTFK